MPPNAHVPGRGEIVHNCTRVTMYADKGGAKESLGPGIAGTETERLTGVSTAAPVSLLTWDSCLPDGGTAVQPATIDRSLGIGSIRWLYAVLRAVLCLLFSSVF